MGGFDPYAQNVTFLASDGKTPLTVPLSMVDAFHTESVSICLNYGAQLGACVIMLAVVFVMTPSPKLRRPSSLLHITGLVLCIIRMALLSAYFPSPFNDFYAYWAYDYSHVPVRDFVISIVANTFSLLLVVAIEAALMHQAWTMVKLWPNFWKYTLSALSAFVTLFTIGWRVAFTVIQNKAVLSLIPPENMRWLIHLMVITNAVSICWFCAIFNIKLIIHLISNRGVLPSYKTMTPMEVLIATNGVLMIVPVIFAGLEWGHFTNFESASLTLTSVAIILPLGTLSAQRMASKTTSAYSSADSSGRYPPTTGTGSSVHPIKKASFSTGHTGTTAQVSILSRCEAAMMSHARPGSSGVELVNLTEEAEADGHQVRVNRNLVQREKGSRSHLVTVTVTVPSNFTLSSRSWAQPGSDAARRIGRSVRDSGFGIRQYGFTSTSALDGLYLVVALIWTCFWSGIIHYSRWYFSQWHCLIFSPSTTHIIAPRYTI